VAAANRRGHQGKEPTDELETIALPDSLCLDEGCDLDALVEWGLS